jgi:hypothetical protein
VPVEEQKREIKSPMPSLPQLQEHINNTGEMTGEIDAKELYENIALRED